jgi:flagellar assembly protein FliH
MPTTTLVAFDRPLSGAYLPGRDGSWMTESALATIRVEAYQRGGDAARAFADQQLVEFRREVQDLQEGLLTRLADVDQRITSQLQATLPSLAVEIARRLLAGYEPTPERVVAVCTEALDQLYPDTEALELLVSPSDAERLEQVDQQWTSRYPGLRVTAVPALRSGDCQVRSRFGLTDARLDAKLESLRRELAPESTAKAS